MKYTIITDSGNKYTGTRITSLDEDDKIIEIESYEMKDVLMFLMKRDCNWLIINRDSDCSIVSPTVIQIDKIESISVTPFYHDWDIYPQVTE